MSTNTRPHRKPSDWLDRWNRPTYIIHEEVPVTDDPYGIDNLDDDSI